MANPLKRVLNPIEAGDAMARPAERLPYQQEIGQYSGDLLDGPRQSQYLGPSYVNPNSDVPVMQPGCSPPELFGGILLDPSVDSLMNLDETEYSLEDALARQATTPK